MTFLQKLEVIDRIDGLIRRKATGSPKDLAQKIGCSERCLYSILNTMKQMQAPIIYAPERGSYMYQHEVDLMIGFVKKEKIYGGSINFHPTADFLQWCDLYLTESW
ncbi:MAG: hypothetical protein ACNS60_09720 [Candidatus Cyclobacteriaceae bacterium M2_1C_046]